MKKHISILFLINLFFIVLFNNWTSAGHSIETDLQSGTSSSSHSTIVNGGSLTSASFSTLPKADSSLLDIYTVSQPEGLDFYIFRHPETNECTLAIPDSCLSQGLNRNYVMAETPWLSQTFSNSISSFCRRQNITISFLDPTQTQETEKPKITCDEVCYFGFCQKTPRDLTEYRDLDWNCSFCDRCAIGNSCIGCCPITCWCHNCIRENGCMCSGHEQVVGCCFFCATAGIDCIMNTSSSIAWSCYRVGGRLKKCCSSTSTSRVTTYSMNGNAQLGKITEANKKLTKLFKESPDKTINDKLVQTILVTLKT